MDIIETLKEKPESFFTDESITAEDIANALLDNESKQKLNLSTDRGRKEITGRAHAVSRLKTAIDNAGKAMTEEWRKKTAKVNERRNCITSALDEVRDTIRKPVDDWKKQEEARVAAHRSTMNRLNDLSHIGHDDTSETIRDRIEKVRSIDTSELAMQEFSDLATERRRNVLQQLEDALSRVLIQEKQAAELAELRKREEERIERERREQEEREQKEREAREAEEARIAEERRKVEIAEAATKAAEQARIEAEERLLHEQRELERQEQERRDREAAERIRKEEEEARRAADLAHRARIHSDIKEALLVGSTILPKQAEEIIRMIDEEKIPHVVITY